MTRNRRDSLITSAIGGFIIGAVTYNRVSILVLVLSCLAWGALVEIVVNSEKTKEA